VSEPQISTDEIETLGRYHAEVSLGIVHDAEHRAAMAALQHRFDARMAWLDDEADRLDAEIEFERGVVLPAWLVWFLLAVSVVVTVTLLVGAL
jgi:hypothetical protein